MAQPILGQVWANAQAAILQRLSEVGVTIDPDTGALSLSEDVLSALAPKPNGHDRDETISFSGDLSAFRDPPAPSVPKAPEFVPSPKPSLDADLDAPITRREFNDLVRQMQGVQTAPGFKAAPPRPTFPSFRSDAVLNVLEAQIRDAWRRRGRA